MSAESPLVMYRVRDLPRHMENLLVAAAFVSVAILTAYPRHFIIKMLLGTIHAVSTYIETKADM